MATYKVCDVCKDKDKKAHNEIEILIQSYKHSIEFSGDFCIDCLVSRIISNYGSEIAPLPKDTCYEDCCYKKATPETPGIGILDVSDNDVPF